MAGMAKKNMEKSAKDKMQDKMQEKKFPPKKGK